MISGAVFLTSSGCASSGAAEGNEFLYENLLQESEAASQAFDPDTWLASRFLYHVPIEEEKAIP